jgi:hypothetical protein
MPTSFYCLDRHPVGRPDMTAWAAARKSLQVIGALLHYHNAVASGRLYFSALPFRASELDNL